MGEIWSWIKAHPYATAAIVFTGGLLFYFLFLRGSGGGASNSSAAAAYYNAQAAAAASGNQLAGLQAQLQASTNQTNAAVSAEATRAATDVQIATLQAQTAQNHDTVTAQAAEATAASNAAVAESQSMATVSVNASNNASTVLENLYDTIVGAQGATADNLTVNGNFVLAGVPSSFNVTKSVAPPNAQALELAADNSFIAAIDQVPGIVHGTTGQPSYEQLNAVLNQIYSAANQRRNTINTIGAAA